MIDPVCIQKVEGVRSVRDARKLLALAAAAKGAKFRIGAELSFLKL